MIKLNLGCGDDVREEYLNVDFRKTDPRVQVQDLSKLPWPWQNGSVEEILMFDFLEHFPYAQTVPILFECYRILTDDGTVVIQVPDAKHVARALISEGEFLCNRCGGQMYDYETAKTVGNPVCLEECPGCGQHQLDIADAAMKRLFGGQDFPGNFHQTCFTFDSLVHLAGQIGLKLVGEEEHGHQYINWNIKLRFRRGPLW